MLCRERSDGSLRGMMLIGIERNGGYTLIKVKIFFNEVIKMNLSFFLVGLGHVYELLSRRSLDVLGLDLRVLERYVHWIANL